jgi:hypothetical protein
VCDVAAHGVVRVAWDAIAALRQRPPVTSGPPLPASFLKNSDEQTVASILAIQQAIGRAGLDAASFTQWGVLAAPRFFGRAMMATVFKSYAAEGAWGVSPHVIPHRSLHAMSGTISQAFKIHGPNFGVSGGPSAVSEGILAAVALLCSDRLPGVWVVMSGCEPEPVMAQAPAELGIAVPPTPPACVAVALALRNARPDYAGLRLRIVPGTLEAAHESTPASELSPFRLAALVETLTSPNLAAVTMMWGINGGVRIEMERASTNVECRMSSVERRVSNAPHSTFDTRHSQFRTAENLQ